MTFDMAKLERRVKALEANRGASLRFGTVTEVSEADGTARVQLPDGQNMVSHPLRVMQPRSLKDKKQCFPDVGEPVACLFAGQGFEQGVVLGAIYSPKCASPNQQSGQDYTKYEDGTEIWYDRTAHKLIAKVKGDVESESTGITRIESAKEITVKAPFINLAGILRITDKDGKAGAGELYGTYLVRQGSLHVPDADVTAAGVSLFKHIHGGVERGPSNTDGPVNSMTNAGGPNPNQPEVYADYFDALYKKPLAGASPMDDLLLCLPQIARTEADFAEIEHEKQGWFQLQAMFHRWFSGLPNTDAETSPEAFWIEMDWIRSFERANVMYHFFLLPIRMFNSSGRKQLEKQLQSDGYLKSTTTPFDYTKVSRIPERGNRPWQVWKKNYFQSIIVNDLGAHIPDGLTCCMGNFNFRALAAGYTEPLPEGGHRITVERLSIFVWDSFNFEGTDELGYWSCRDKAFSWDWLNDSYHFIYNKYFQEFRNKYKRGYDFMVLSMPQNVDDFKGFQYDTEL